MKVNFFLIGSLHMCNAQNGCESIENRKITLKNAYCTKNKYTIVVYHNPTNKALNKMYDTANTNQTSNPIYHVYHPNTNHLCE